jgi:hypothetical protein
MMDKTSSLNELRANFLATSTQSMPIAGVLFWTVAAIASQILPIQQLAYFVGFGSGTVFPLGMIIDKLRGRSAPMGSSENPVVSMFMQCVSTVAILWPMVIIAGISNPLLIVLGGAILMGIVWIPYGWAADDPVGLQHTIGRSVAAYAAYLFAPEPWTATAICVVVLLSYAYSFLRMKKPPA